MLELDDIQSGVLRPRPTPYVATYIALRIDDRQAGRALMQRISNAVTSAANPESPLADTWVSVALTYHGLKALDVPQESLDSLSWEFRQGMAARASDLADVGESDPQNWEQPLGGSDVHVIIVAVSPDAERLEAAVARARETYQTMTGIEAIWRQNCHALPNDKEPFGFRDGISHPAIEGSGIPGTWRRAKDHARNTRPQRHVRRFSQASSTGCRLSPLSQNEFELFRRRRIAGSQDDGPLAQWRSARAVPFS